MEWKISVTPPAYFIVLFLLQTLTNIFIFGFNSGPPQDPKWSSPNLEGIYIWNRMSSKEHVDGKFIRVQEVHSAC